MGGSFSLAGLHTACVFEMKAMVAVAPSRIYCIMPPYGEEFFSRSHYVDILKCYRIRALMLSLSDRLRTNDHLWELVASDLSLGYRTAPLS